MHLLPNSYALVGFVFLFLGPQAVLSRFNSISFSNVQQCGEFSVHFSGGKAPSSLPLTLTIVPLNSAPIAITIPDSDWNATSASGAVVTFLPLAAGTPFVASLDDANGHGTGLVSDIVTVASSNDSSCINNSTATSTLYTVPDVLTQCGVFDVSYNSTLLNPPSIRVFQPNGASFKLNQTNEADPAGTASYVMAASSGTQAVLLLSDNGEYAQTSNLLSVNSGDSDDTCVPVTAFSTATETTTSSSSSKGGLSRAAVVAIAAASAVVVGGIVLVSAIWLCRERRRAERMALADMEAQSSKKNRDWEFDPGTPPAIYVRAESPMTPNGYRRSPPYINVNLSPITPQFASTAEVSNVATYGTSIPPVSPQRSAARRSSISSEDYEHILEMATIYASAPDFGARPDSRLSRIHRTPSLQHLPVPFPTRAANPGAPAVSPLNITSSYRGPPRAPLPSSPLPSPDMREQFDPATSPFPQSFTSSPHASGVYSEAGPEDDIPAFSMVTPVARPPPALLSDGRSASFERYELNLDPNAPRPTARSPFR